MIAMKEGRIPPTPPGKPNRSVNTASHEVQGVAV